MTNIHPQAIVDPKAELAQGVEVGPFAIIGSGVTIGAGSVIGPHAIVKGSTRLGEGNHSSSNSGVPLASYCSDQCSKKVTLRAVSQVSVVPNYYCQSR